MAVTRKIIAHDDNENQWLKVDHSSRYIANQDKDWQFLFGVDSVLSTSTQVVKISAKFNEETFDSIKIASYLYDQKTRAISSGSSCILRIYKVTNPNWTENLIATFNPTILANSYFYINVSLDDLPGIDFDGGDSILIEASIVRLGITYHERIYFNHLGIYENITRLRNDVEFMDITKADE